jgi:hypothetical protein
MKLGFRLDQDHPRRQPFSEGHGVLDQSANLKTRHARPNLRADRHPAGPLKPFASSDRGRPL